MALQNYPHWRWLIGALVEIRRYDQAVRTGFVEDAMPDSSVLWIAADGVHPRNMYDAAENYTAWVEPQQLTDAAAYRMTSAQLYS
jgi:hypothetical protein